MKTADLDTMTSKVIRIQLEDQMERNLETYKSFIDKEILVILGQMDPASKIQEYLYLGSEWNASNLDELSHNGITHILNVTREIDNFFPGNFRYLNVRVYDEEATDLVSFIFGLFLSFYNLLSFKNVSLISVIFIILCRFCQFHFFYYFFHLILSKSLRFLFLFILISHINSPYTFNCYSFALNTKLKPKTVDILQLKHFNSTYTFIKEAKNNGGKVLVHCKMGISRSASVTISFLMKENEWNLDTAMFRVKKARSIVSPNKSFIKQVHFYFL